MSAPAEVVGRDALVEERDFLLQEPLHDLDAEHSAGDIDDADYEALRDDYTSRAAAALRRLDLLDHPEPVVPVVADVVPDVASGPDVASDAPGRPPRSWRKVGVLVVVGLAVAGRIGYGIARATSPRLAGETVSGEVAGNQAIAAELLKAQEAEDNGNGVAALKDYRAILRTNPHQAQALTGEGWLLVQTQISTEVEQGVNLLKQAEDSDPTYSPAYVYLGTGLYLGEDYKDAIPQFEYYLAHNPDPSLVAGVRQTLSDAEAKLAASPPTT